MFKKPPTDQRWHEQEITSFGISVHSLYSLRVNIADCLVKSLSNKVCNRRVESGIILISGWWTVKRCPVCAMPSLSISSSCYCWGSPRVALQCVIFITVHIFSRYDLFPSSSWADYYFLSPNRFIPCNRNWWCWAFNITQEWHRRLYFVTTTRRGVLLELPEFCI